MRQRFSLIGSNPLLQRVRRITSMPTLYRAPDPAARTAPSRPAQRAGSASPPVVATLYRSSDSATQPLPATQAVPLPTVQVAPAVSPRPPAPTATPEAGRPQPEQSLQPAQPGQQVQPDQPGQAPANQDDDWGWIDDRQWEKLKSFMAGHQQVVAEEQARQAEIQRSPEAIQRTEEKRRAEAELARRQDLARSGQLPRAQVVYLSPEEKAAGTAPPPESPAGPVSAAQDAEPASEPPIAARPEDAITGDTTPVSEKSSPETMMRKPAQPPATTTLPEQAPTKPERPAEMERSAEVEQPAAQVAGLPPQTQNVPGQPKATPEVEPAGQDEPAPGSEAPGAGQRLLQAARSLFRRSVGADEAQPAAEQTEPAAETSAETPAAIPEPMDNAPLDPVATSPAETPVVQRTPEPPVAPPPPVPPAKPPAMTPVSELPEQVAGGELEDAPAPASEPVTDVPHSSSQIAREASPAPPAAPLPPAPQPESPEQASLAEAPAGDTPPTLPDLPVEPTQEAPATGAPPVDPPPQASLTRPAAGATASPGEPAQMPEVAPDEAVESPPPEPALADDSGRAAIDDDQESIDTVIAPLPLQQVWQVEEKAAPPSRPPAQPSKPASPPVQRKPAGGDSMSEEVHSALREVAPGKDTDSSIELVTPRRPRPDIPPPTIRRQAGDAPPPEQPGPGQPPEDHLPPVDQAPKIASTRPADAAPKTLDAPARPAASEPHMVPTEIGELPSDLWALLGERPPTPAAGHPDSPPVATTVQRAETGAPAVAEMPAPARPDSVTQTVLREPVTPVTRYFAPPAVQRIDVEQPAAAGEASQDAELAESEDSTRSDEEPDIDKLARAILPEIKRRLAIDWERGRGRLR